MYLRYEAMQLLQANPAPEVEIRDHVTAGSRAARHRDCETNFRDLRESVFIAVHRCLLLDSSAPLNPFSQVFTMYRMAGAQGSGLRPIT